MKDFDIVKYLREHQLGSYGILNHYVDIKPLKEEDNAMYITPEEAEEKAKQIAPFVTSVQAKDDGEIESGTYKDKNGKVRDLTPDERDALNDSYETRFNLIDRLKGNLEEEETTTEPKPLRLRSIKDLLLKYKEDDESIRLDKEAIISRIKKTFEEVIDKVKRMVDKDIKIEEKDGYYQIADVSAFDKEDMKWLQGYIRHVGIHNLEDDGGFNWYKKNESQKEVSEDHIEELYGGYGSYDPSNPPDISGKFIGGRETEDNTQILTKAIEALSKAGLTLDQIKAVASTIENDPETLEQALAFE